MQSEKSHCRAACSPPFSCVIAVVTCLGSGRHFGKSKLGKAVEEKTRQVPKDLDRFYYFFFFFSSKELKVPIIVQLSNKSRGNLKGICNNRKIVCPRDEEGFTLWL